MRRLIKNPLILFRGFFKITYFTLTLNEHLFLMVCCFLFFSEEEKKTGGDLLSNTVARAVSSALVVLTSVFEMGTGVSPPISPPEKSAHSLCVILFQLMILSDSR